MKRHRFYVKEKVLERYFTFKTSFTLPDEGLTHQLIQVFRFRTGDEIILFDGSGFDYVSQINKQKKLTFTISQKIKNEISPKREVTLFLSLIKKDNFELSAGKVTELGITSIVPIISSRSEKKSLNLERLTKITIEATEQSGRDLPPIIGHIIPLEEAAKTFSARKIAFHLGEQAFHSKKNDSKVDEPLGIFIGPEGGWDEHDLNLLRKEGVEFYSLGQATMRAETAAIVTTALLLS